MKRSCAWFPRWLVPAVAGLALLAASTRAASLGEMRAFTSAQRAFDGGWWDLADQEFGAFNDKYPKADRHAEAVLRQAQARYKLHNSAGAVALLSANLDQAGSLGDEFQYWLAESQFQGSNYLGAAVAYARLVRDFPDSVHTPQAAQDQALAYSRLGDWPKVVALLADTNSVMQKLLRTSPTNSLAAQGALLLAEAQVAQRNFQGAEAALRPLDGVSLPARSDWLRQYLLCRAQLGEGLAVEALQCATNLAAIATASGQRDLQSETADFKASILRALGKPDAAVAELEQNLGEDQPVARRRQALLEIVEIRMDQGRLDEAAQRLDKLLAQFPQEASSGGVLLALGELNLRRCLAAPSTNCLPAALAQFELLATNGPANPLYGRAQLDRGWCLWLMGRTNESQPAFEAAALALPRSPEQAVARFKWADTQFAQRDFAGALTNYSFIADDLASLPPVRDHWLEPALYQVFRTGLALGDYRAASNAVARILAVFPQSFVCQSSLLQLGQSLNRSGDPAAARESYLQFEKQFPDSSLLPEVNLALARTWERQTNWLAALAVYDAWVTNYTSNPSLPQAEYDRGWADYQAERESAAFAVFTNLVTRFPTNEFAALAQNWIADYYFRHGDFVSAEDNYQLLFKKWPGSRFEYQARLMAARAAVARLQFADSLPYFLTNINDLKRCPPNLVAQSLFELADATARMDSPDTNRPLANYEEAIRAFSKLQQLFPTNELSLLALGRMGDCYLQLGGQNPDMLTNAASAYQRLLDDPRASVAARSQAEVGLGVVLEKQARRKPEAEPGPIRQLALQHYLHVVYGQGLREGEKADPFWVKKAGLEAVRLAEELQLWEQTAELYDYLGRLLPVLKPVLEPRLAKVKERIAASGK